MTVAAKRRTGRQSLVALALLWLLVLASALGVVASTHKHRQQVNRLETLRQEADELQVVWGQYLLERSTWASYSRVQRLAREQLSMRLPRTRDIVVVQRD